MMSLKDVSERTSAVNDVIDSCDCVHTTQLPMQFMLFYMTLFTKATIKQIWN